MPCYKPLEAWRTLENTSNGKKKIVFKESEKTITKLSVPCGRCIGCKLDRSLMWAIRCVHESQLHQDNSFITLTYSTEHLPTDGSLVVSHFQDFMKRLRKQYPNTKIRYYMCGEYGEKLTRPHYHACLFGLNFHDREIHEENEGILLYTSEKLARIWGKGHCTIGELNFETAAYTARYIAKKITGEAAHEHYQTTCPTTGQTINLQSEYTTMSRKPGIAMQWFRKYREDVYPSDYLIHQGRTVKVPRFYDNQLTEEGLKEIKAKRKKRAKAFQKDNTPERLAVREEIKTLNYKQLTRSYENEL